MMRKVLVVIMILLCFILQSTVFRSLAFGGIIPNLMMIPVPYEHLEGDKTFEYRPIEKVDLKPYDGIAEMDVIFHT
jgi:hypothetical protein